MTTLPATIPGLVRRGSPVISRAGDRVVVCELIPGFGARCFDRGQLWTYTLRSISLDLDPTGRVHALLWLAEKLGMDARYGLLWCHVPRQDFDHGQYTPAYLLLAGATPDSDGITLRSWRWAFTEESSDDPRCAEYFFGKDANLPPDGYTTVPNILSVGDTEALRLAGLAVAGVEG